MGYINGGVHGATSKKALKEAVKADPERVQFFSTAMFGETFNGPVSSMPDGATLQVVGPDPFNKRDWYASIKKTAKGFTVS